MSVRTILFDFDGTLADTNELISQSFLTVLNKHFPGCYNKESVRRFNGPPLNDVFAELDPGDSLGLKRQYLTINEKLHDERISLFPGVYDSLEVLNNAGIQLGIVSTKRRKMVERGLTLLNIASFFSVVVAGGDCQRAKPHPEPIHLAMKLCQANPADTLMVGDSWQDIEAANAAGVTSVFVSWSAKPLEEIISYHPNIIIDNMIELEQLINS